MLRKTKYIIKKIVEKLGYEIVRLPSSTYFPPEMEQEFREIYGRCKSYSMTSLERMYALYKAVHYIVNSKIEGDFVECGVWKGGNCMLMAYTLLKLGESNRRIYLYDTFADMPTPTEKDKTIRNETYVIKLWENLQRKDYNDLEFSPFDEVRNNMLATGYPEGNILFIKGKVEDTIPGIIPSAISLLRLDTDWYESTYHELVYLFPILSNRGVIIIDDYGHWMGAKEAVDKYFSERKISILLNRIDYTGRLGIK